MANPLLFQPYRLRGLEIRNRLWAAPMCQYSAVAESGPGEGVPGDWHVQHLGGLGRGGAGLVMVEATAVVPEGRISPGCLGLYSDEQEAAFARIVPLVRAHGARIGIQLAHAGRKASTYRSLPGEPEGSVPEGAGGWQTVAPSAEPFDGLATPRELSVAGIEGVVEAFVAAAERAVRIGFDAVEVHAAHGYLLHEFLSPLSNRRTDGYGGTPENRARLTREVVRGIRAAHPELPIIVRISGDEWVEGGFDRDAAVQLTGWLAEDGADLIDCSSAGNTGRAPIPVGPSYQVPIAARVREAGLPVGAVGLITQPEQAEGILASGQADVISLARPLLADPHLPIAWAHRLRAENAASLVPPQYARARF
ncbi:NADH:flavin oxidoreductase/NADH oxidase [Leucobacter weissii]|uniref:NADH:flavin oxidoreductase/NADH oxidase n=1 Tax=Leucobacter weissii TaxID=1983706 RepID=A0A939SAZ0_9MICO|nr:NADH:flavin oxidoreductase/NADH oxidase [Leucobacter weissii]MBO1900883.1 NADH:flavin oxidoreductase/NADH oxidase [Leucobacter weissii]